MRTPLFMYTYWMCPASEMGMQMSLLKFKKSMEGLMMMYALV